MSDNASSSNDYRTLLKRHRDWLADPDPRSSFACFGFEVGQGWYKLIARLFDDLAAIITPSRQRLEVRQVKEKFGTLRFYWQDSFDVDTSARISAAVDLAEFRSEVTCETCGGPGRLVCASGWLLTRCPDHEPRGASDVNPPGPIVRHSYAVGEGKYEVIAYDPETDTVSRRRMTKQEFERAIKS